MTSPAPAGRRQATVYHASFADDRRDISTIRSVDKRGDGITDRPQVRAARIEDDGIGALGRFERADLAVTSEDARGIDRHHLQELPRAGIRGAGAERAHDPGALVELA